MTYHTFTLIFIIASTLLMMFIAILFKKDTWLNIFVKFSLTLTSLMGFYILFAEFHKTVTP